VSEISRCLLKIVTSCPAYFVNSRTAGRAQQQYLTLHEAEQLTSNERNNYANITGYGVYIDFPWDLDFSEWLIRLSTEQDCIFLALLHAGNFRQKLSNK